MLSNSKYLFNGSTNLDSVCETFKTDIFKQENCNTISGFVLNYLEKIPNSNEKFSLTNTDKFETFEISIIEVNNKKINKIQIEKILNKKEV